MMKELIHIFFKENKSYISHIEFHFDLNVESNIDARDIVAPNIRVFDIDAGSIKAQYIRAYNIHAYSVSADCIIRDVRGDRR